MATLNRDKLNNADAERVAKAAMATLTALQEHPKEAQIIGTAVTFLALSEEHGISAQEAMTITKNLIAHETTYRPEFRAVADYVAGELA